MRALLLAGLVVCLSPAKEEIHAQEKAPAQNKALAHDNTAAFEVASIKPAAPDARGMGMQTLPGGRINLKNVTLRLAIEMAWGLQDYQIQAGPAWLDNRHFDVVAKPPEEIARTPEGNELRRRMIRNLLETRFSLVWHGETKELPIYALVVGKNGPKLKPFAEGEQASSMMGRGRLDAKASQVSDLARMLSNTLQRTVLDETGLAGKFDYQMQWTPDTGESLVPKGLPQQPPEPAAPEGPSIFTALQEQLGLKLESRKGPVEMFVIERAELPSEN